MNVVSQRGCPWGGGLCVLPKLEHEMGQKDSICRLARSIDSLGWRRVSVYFT